MGDLSQIMPVIHPYTGGVSGMGHSVDYQVQNYEQAVINPAKALAMSVIDLLSDDAKKAKEVIHNSSPPMTKKGYLAYQEKRMLEETYDGV